MLFAQYIDLSSLILRLAIGSAFMIHGYPKLTSNEQGKGWMKSMGMPVALIPFAGVVEFFGGLEMTSPSRDFGASLSQVRQRFYRRRWIPVSGNSGRKTFPEIDPQRTL